MFSETTLRGQPIGTRMKMYSGLFVHHGLTLASGLRSRNKPCASLWNWNRGTMSRAWADACRSAATPGRNTNQTFGPRISQCRREYKHETVHCPVSYTHLDVYKRQPLSHPNVVERDRHLERWTEKHALGICPQRKTSYIWSRLLHVFTAVAGMKAKSNRRRFT